MRLNHRATALDGTTIRTAESLNRKATELADRLQNIGRQMPVQAQQTIAKMAEILAPQQTTKINVNGYTDNTPIGPSGLL
jgi:flagellar motor protein MotB